MKKDRGTQQQEKHPAQEDDGAGGSLRVFEVRGLRFPETEIEYVFRPEFAEPHHGADEEDQDGARSSRFEALDQKQPQQDGRGNHYEE